MSAQKHDRYWFAVLYLLIGAICGMVAINSSHLWLLIAATVVGITLLAIGLVMIVFLFLCS